MPQTFDATLQKFNSNLWGHHIMVPEEIVSYFKAKKISRLNATLQDNVMFQCALMPSGQGEYFINVNKDIRKKANWRIGEKRTVILKADESKYGIAISEELEELLALDPEGSEIFHRLTPGKQRSLIYAVSSPKQSKTRLKKSVIMIDYLKSVDGKLDFKELNQAFKDRKDDF